MYRRFTQLVVVFAVFAMASLAYAKPAPVCEKCKACRPHPVMKLGQKVHNGVVAVRNNCAARQACRKARRTCKPACAPAACAPAACAPAACAPVCKPWTKRCWRPLLKLRCRRCGCLCVTPMKMRGMHKGPHMMAPMRGPHVKGMHKGPHMKGMHKGMHKGPHMKGKVRREKAPRRPL